MAGHLGTATLKSMANGSTAVTLNSGQSQLIPCGDWIIMPGSYTVVEFYDPVGQAWRANGAAGSEAITFVSSDGANYRLFNLSGTVMGGVVTNGGTANTAKNGIWAAGSSSTTGVIATTTAGSAAPAGTAQFNVIVGGAINTSVTVVAGGTGYVKPPLVTFANPPAGGLVATGYAVLTAGAVSSLTVTNQGAGYTSTPQVILTNTPGDIGSGASATCTIDTATNGGKIVAVTMADRGSGYTAVPTVTIGGLAGSPAITPIMALSVITAPTVTAASGGANGYQMQSVSGLTAGTNTTTNPLYTTSVVGIRNAVYAYGTSATFATQVLLDGGISQIASANNCVFQLASTGTVPAATTVASGAMGAQIDQSFVIPM